MLTSECICALTALTHSWVNIDSMIDTAMVGILASE